MQKTEKTKLVEELIQKLEKSNSIFLADFTGLNVEDITRLRRNLKEKEIDFKIAKNTLTRLAAKESGKEAIVDYLQGPVGVAYIYGDPTWAAKIFYESYKKIEKPKIKAFLIENQLYTGEKLKEWATLPPKEEVLAELVAALNAPMAQLVGILNAVIQNFVLTLEGMAEKKSKEEPIAQAPAQEVSAAETITEISETPAPSVETQIKPEATSEESEAPNPENQTSENQSN
ncbi:MAG TPA: 50S ribosomal protein L10 [candidate division Zixibacteria bacterium]|nr:50S ribosomal protein L10 [candidate division Zixibacteria bacterium]